LNLAWFEVVGLGPVAVFAIFPVNIIVLPEERIVVFVESIRNLLQYHALLHLFFGESCDFVLKFNLFPQVHFGWINNFTVLERSIHGILDDKSQFDVSVLHWVICNQSTKLTEHDEWPCHQKHENEADEESEDAFLDPCGLRSD
jgi:hypothetical protein